MTEAVHAERRGAAWILRVDRPATRNAVDGAVHDGLARALDAVEAAPPGDARAVILTGAGGSFLSGGDLREIRARPFDETLAFCGRMGALLDRLEGLPQPVLAAIDGPALGGGLEVALACDVRVAGEGATLSFRHAAMGLTTGWGAATRLARLVPRGTAARLTMTAEVLDAERALALGIVDEVVRAGGAVERCLELAGEIARRSPRAIAGFKAVLRAAYGASPAQARVRERAVFEELWGAGDHAEALEAFFARRDPEWPAG